MEVGGSLSGGVETKQRLKEYAEVLGRDFVSLVTQEARGLAVTLGGYTFPLGLKDGDGKKLQERVKNEIMQLFPSLGDGQVGAVRIYGLLESSSPQVAKAFWNAYKSGDQQAMEAAMATRVRGLPRKLNPSKHKSLRTGKYGRVLRGAKPVAVVRKSARDNYIKKQQRKAGMAKAGWLAAAKGLGGRVRRGGGRSGGTNETFPAWVRKAGARRKLGGATVRNGNGVLRIALRNAVRHADEALLLSLLQRAEVDASRNFQRSLNKSVSFQSAKYRRRLAA